MLLQEIIVNEFGRLCLATDNGDPFSGPYDTFEEAEAALYSGSDDEDDTGSAVPLKQPKW